MLLAARLLGKEEGRVQFPDGPLTNKWGVGPTGRRLVCTQEIGVRLPDAPLDKRAHGPTGRRQLGRLEIRVRFPGNAKIFFLISAIFLKTAFF